MKYKYNGEWVDVNIKALDSMPLGTQVEYTGTDIPAGWEQVNDYSTTEIDTGKRWIDGKKIYRKVLHYDTYSFTASDNQFDAGISNVSQCISIKYRFKYNNNSYTNWDALRNIIYFISTNKVSITSVSALSVANLDIIIEYTKSS